MKSGGCSKQLSDSLEKAVEKQETMKKNVEQKQLSM
jgi:hypothetical protein